MKKLNRNSFQTVKKAGLMAVLILLLFVSFSGCIGNSDNSGSGKDTITVTDAFGRTVEVPDNPEKIAVSGSGSMRYFVYLGVIDRVVAVDYQDNSSNLMPKDKRPYALAHPEIKEKPLLGTSKGLVDAEKLLAANPDVLFYSATSSNDIAAADQIQSKTGIPVVLFYNGNYVTEKDKIDETLLMIGKILHKEQRAQDIIQYFETTAADLTNRIKDVPASNKTVFVGGVAYNGPHGLNGTNPIYMPFEILNADNVAAGVPLSGPSTGYALVSKEIILEWDPEIIFVDVETVTAAGGGAFVELKNDPSYKGLSAAKSGEIYAVNPHTSMGVNHETALANCYYIGKILYPEQFKDVDPAEKADEIYTFIVGKPVFNQIKQNADGLSYTKVNLTK
ncbi:iron ABC transporter substrate-binding protein [Methanimicrococcus sp. OttesenSCG-928-J09]|nr:iron ABC transporter substrate-binding protein [Methanimicrococcus sp. OttesenSCG-928-J09]